MVKQRNIEKVSAELKTAIGESKVTCDKDIMEKYSRDETSDLSSLPNLIVRAQSVKDVSNTLRICNNYKVPVIPRGAGTGVTGGAVPIKGGVILSLERMNRILELDIKNMVALVEPGVITGDIQKAALEHGLMYPPDPASLETCSIGGNVAEGAGGPRAVKYGTTKDYVLGLEIVLPDGSIINTGGKFVKNATGYNLLGIIISSEGTLAVVTKIYLRLVPAPSQTLDLLLPFDNLNKAIDAVTGILQNRIVPATIEFMEEDAIRLVSVFLKEEIPFPEARAHLLIQVDGNSEDEIASSLERLTKSIDIPHEKIVIAETAGQKNRLWKARRSIREAIHNKSPVFLAEDCVVPRAEIPSYVKNLKEKFNTLGLPSILFGHAGDGNVHTDVLKGDMNYDRWIKLIPQLKKMIYETAIELGGTITGEHGIGCIRKDYLHMALSNEEIQLLKRIKKAFDPNTILNPGKIFD